VNQNHKGSVTPSLTNIPSRRDILRGLVSLGLGLGLPPVPANTSARKAGKPKPKSRNGLCARDGSKCRKPGKTCKKRHCPRAPFTIEASWTESADHESILFLPPRDETTGPWPEIFSFCNPGNSRCAEQYPFACVDADVYTTGVETTTIYRTLPGAYEYWVELDSRPTNPNGEVTVTLKDRGGRVVRRWSRRADPAVSKLGWHVFDVDGRNGRVKSIDAVLTEEPLYLPNGAHDPYTLVCPYFS
jgi:hypothetical protein